MTRRIKTLVGKRFGKLIVLEEIAQSPEQIITEARWKCICDCGKFIELKGESLYTYAKMNRGCRYCSTSMKNPRKDRQLRSMLFAL